jgi:hypothetical protein
MGLTLGFGVGRAFCHRARCLVNLSVVAVSSLVVVGSGLW